MNNKLVFASVIMCMIVLSACVEDRPTNLEKQEEITSSYEDQRIVFLSFVKIGHRESNLYTYSSKNNEYKINYRIRQWKISEVYDGYITYSANDIEDIYNGSRNFTNFTFSDGGILYDWVGDDYFYVTPDTQFGKSVQREVTAQYKGKDYKLTFAWPISPPGFISANLEEIIVTIEGVGEYNKINYGIHVNYFVSLFKDMINNDMEIRCALFLDLENFDIIPCGCEDFDKVNFSNDEILNTQFRIKLDMENYYKTYRECDCQYEECRCHGEQKIAKITIFENPDQYNRISYIDIDSPQFTFNNHKFEILSESKVNIDEVGYTFNYATEAMEKIRTIPYNIGKECHNQVESRGKYIEVNGDIYLFKTYKCENDSLYWYTIISLLRRSHIQIEINKEYIYTPCNIGDNPRGGNEVTIIVNGNELKLYVKVEYSGKLFEKVFTISDTFPCAYEIIFNYDSNTIELLKV